MVQLYKKNHDVSIMVWACFWGMYRFELYALIRDFKIKRNDYSANFYIQILDDNLLEIYEPANQALFSCKTTLQFIPPKSEKMI